MTEPKEWAREEAERLTPFSHCHCWPKKHEKGCQTVVKMEKVLLNAEARGKREILERLKKVQANLELASNKNHSHPGWRDGAKVVLEIFTKLKREVGQGSQD